MTRDLPHLPEKPILNRIACGLVASVLSVTMLGMASARAKADDLEDKRNQLDSQIEAQKSVVEGASKDLTDAIAALDSSKTELAEAEASLAQAESRLSEAKELDSQRAAELKAAETKAEKAQADVAAAQAAYDSVDARTSEEITVITQQSGALAELSVLFNDVGTGNINQRAQLADTLFSSSALELDELTERRFRLDTAKKEADEAEAKAEELRKAAADQLEASKQAEQDAAAKRSEVAEKVAQHDAAREKADSQLNAEKGRQSELESESKDVDRRIQERIVRRANARLSRNPLRTPVPRPVLVQTLGLARRVPRPMLVSSILWMAESALPMACAFTPSSATANCMMAPTSLPAAAPRSVPRATAWSLNVTSTLGMGIAS